MQGFRGPGFLILSVICSQLVFGQFFDPKMEDKAYLDSVESNIMEQVNEVKDELLDQASITQHVTKTFIAAQLKRNMFKALRVLAEKELGLEPSGDRPRQPRQDGDEGGDEESSGSDTTRGPSMILPQVANLIKAVFGGNINLTSYVESASTLLPKPIANQLVGVVKLLANNPGNKYTSTVAPATTAAPTVRSVSGNATSEAPTTQTEATSTARATTTTTVTTTTPTTTTEEDEDTEEEFGFAERAANSRQFQIPGLDILGSLVNAVTNNNGNNNNRNKNTVQSNAKPQASDEDLLSGIGSAINNVGQAITNNNGNNGGSRPASSSVNTNSNGGGNGATGNQQLSGIDVGNLGKEIRNGLGDIIKIMPDIFRGANEAYKLLSAVSGLFSGLGGDGAA